MLRDLRDTKRNRRKLLLFAIAMCRRNLEQNPIDACKQGIDAIELIADGNIQSDSLERYCTPLEQMRAVLIADSDQEIAQRKVRSITAILHALRFKKASLMDISNLTSGQAKTEQRVHVAFLHDIFGNPFRPVTFDPVWQTSTAIALARTMYDARDFAAMPILADALEEAGCDVPEVLTHCRDPQGVHVRGCWVVDLVLGKS